MAQREEETSARAFSCPDARVSWRRCQSPPHGAPSPSAPLHVSPLGRPCVHEPRSRLAPEHGAAGNSPQTSRGPGVDRGQTTRSCGPGMDQGWGESWSSGGRRQMSPARKTWLHRVVSRGSCSFRHSYGPFARARAPSRGRPRTDPRPHSRAWGTLKGQWAPVMVDPTRAQVQGGTLMSGVHKGGQAPEPPGQLSSWAAGVCTPRWHLGSPRWHPGSSRWCPGPPRCLPMCGSGWPAGKEETLEGLVPVGSQRLI